METKTVAKVAPAPTKTTRVPMTEQALRDAVAGGMKKKEMLERFEVDGAPVGIYALRTALIKHGLAKKKAVPNFKEMNLVFEAIKAGANSQKKVVDATGLLPEKVESCIKIMLSDGSLIESISVAD